MAKIARRPFLRGVAFLALTGTGSALLAACSGGSAPANPTAASAGSGAASPAGQPTSAAAQPTTAPAAAPAAKPTQAAAPAASSAKSSGAVQLTAASWSTRPDSRNWITKQLFPDFQKSNPSVSVQIVWHDVSKVNEQLLAAFAAGTPPDLFQGGISSFGAYYSAQGQLHDLTSYTKDWPVRQDYFDSSWNVGVYSGKVFALTQTHDVQVLFYRKDFFQEAGLDPAKPLTTWDEARQAALKLVKRNGDKVTRAGYYCPTSSFTGVQSGWWPFMVQNGGWLLTPDLTKSDVDSPETIAGMQFYHDLLYTDKLDAVGGIPTGAQISPIVAGVAALGTFGSGSAIYDMKANAPDKYNNLGAFEPLTKKRQAAFLGGTAQMMAGPTKHPDDAWKLMSFWDTADNLSIYAQDEQQLPPMKSLLDKPPIKGDALFETALKTVAVGIPWPPSPHHADYRLEIVAMSESFMLNQKTVQQAAKDTAQKMNTILAKK